MEEIGEVLRRLDAGSAPGIETDGLIQPPAGAEHPCGRCGGRGWFTPEVPVGHPEFGRMIACECQQERVEEERHARLLRYSNLGHLTRFTFERLEPDGRTGDLAASRMFSDAVRKAMDYADRPVGWLVIVGANGAGKTHLAAAVANRRIESGQAALFMHVPDLMDNLRASFGPTSELSYDELFERVRSTPFLVLDGLNDQAASPWAREKLQQILNHRFNAELPTIVTTAVDLRDLDPYLSARLEAPGLSDVVRLSAGISHRTHRLGHIEPAMLERMTFERFDVRGNNPTDGQRASLEHAFMAAQNFASYPDGWLTLFGETGVGKTHLVVAIAVQQIERGRPVFFAFVPELLDYLRYTFSPQSAITYDRLFEEVKNTPLLLLDDLGQEHTSSWAYEKLYQIIVHRHNARLATVVTTSLELTDADPEGEPGPNDKFGPISSRLRDGEAGTLMQIVAPDYRNRAKRGRRTTKGPARRGRAGR